MLLREKEMFDHLPFISLLLPVIPPFYLPSISGYIPAAFITILPNSIFPVFLFTLYFSSFSTNPPILKDICRSKISLSIAYSLMFYQKLIAIL
jgi:hypothetical protein